MKKNKTGKYFKYAIGEIVLVIIGILIALSINNWNTNKNILKQQKKIINQVILDLQQSEGELIKIIAFYDKQALASAYVSQSFWNKEELSDSLVRSFRVPLSNQRYRPNMSMINSLINSGDIQLISYVKIRSNITAYFENTNTLLDDILRYEEQYYSTGVENILKNMDVYSFDFENSKNEIFESKKYFKYSPYPKNFDKVPFPIQLQEIYNNRQIYNGYINLLTSFRNTKYRYQEILEGTQELLHTLKEEGYE